MPTKHTVQAGETLLDLCRQYAFGDAGTIISHPANIALRAPGRDPNALVPGEEVAIPEKREKWILCEAGAKHVFSLRRPRPRLRVTISDPNGVVHGGRPYRLTIGELVRNGVTSEHGEVDEEVPASAASAVIEVWTAHATEDPDLVWELELGALAPVSDVKGIQARLNNLGFDAGTPDGTLNEKTRAALRRFRAFAGLPEDAAKLDDEAALAALREIHDAHDVPEEV